MNWLRTRSRKSFAGRRPGRTHLECEQLENRRLLAVASHAGLVIPHVAVDTVYYGAGWSQSPAVARQPAQLDSFFADVVNSPYMDMLAEYGVGRGTLENHATFLDGPGAGAVTDADLRAMLADRSARGLLNAPAPNRVFVIFTGPGLLVQRRGTSSAPGGGNFFGYHDSFALPGGGTFSYAVIPYPGGVNASLPPLSAWQQLTGVASHELAEAVTDPDLHSGWFDAAGNEIGDLVNLHYGALHGYTVQYEWSNRAQAGVLWNETAHWVALGQGQVSRLAAAPNPAGGQDVFGIGLNNDVYLQTLGPPGGPYAGGGWADLGGQAAQIAVGRDADGSPVLFAIDRNTGAVNVYATRTGAWTSLGGYARALAVANHADGRLEVFVVGGNGQVYHQGESAANGPFAGGWAGLGGSAQSLTAAREQDGRLDVFAVWADNSVRFIKEVPGAAGWGPAWINLGGWAYAGSVAVGADAAGRLELFVIGSDHQVYRRWQSTANGAFDGGWVSLGGWVSQIAVGRRADGRLCVIGVGGDGGVYEIPEVYGSANWNLGWVAEGEWAQALGVDLSGREVLLVGEGGAPDLLPLG
jgi:hypothetical protein